MKHIIFGLILSVGLNSHSVKANTNDVDQRAKEVCELFEILNNQTYIDLCESFVLIHSGGLELEKHLNKIKHDNYYDTSVVIEHSSYNLSFRESNSFIGLRMGQLGYTEVCQDFPNQASRRFKRADFSIQEYVTTLAACFEAKVN